jgi:pyridoxamine 5'-phosphate oxidase
VRVEGRVERVDAATSDAYFAQRPRASQLGASASPQSRVVADRSELERAFAAAEARYAGAEVPRPAGWGGYRVIPASVEFWQGRQSRLHDRLRYRRVDGDWRIERLAP